MARNKSNTLNPAAYGLTVQEATRLIRIHDLCKGMDDDAFEQMETAAASINLVASLKKLDNRHINIDIEIRHTMFIPVSALSAGFLKNIITN